MASFVNEELVLLRAQAEIGTGDLAAATNDLNLKKEFANDSFTAALPVPKGEADAHGGNVTPVCK